MSGPMTMQGMIKLAAQKGLDKLKVYFDMDHGLVHLTAQEGRRSCNISMAMGEMDLDVDGEHMRTLVDHLVEKIRGRR